MLAYVTTPKRHATRYDVAKRYIEAHGHFAAVTLDGLLALADEGGVEVPHVFPIAEGGTVSSHDVRQWLGY